MVHIIITLPISIQSPGQKLLAIIPSWSTCPPCWQRTTWSAYSSRRGIAKVAGNCIKVEWTPDRRALAIGWIGRTRGIGGLATIVGLLAVLLWHRLLLLLHNTLRLAGMAIIPRILTLHWMLLLLLLLWHSMLLLLLLLPWHYAPMLHVLLRWISMLLGVAILRMLLLLLLRHSLLARVKIGIVSALVGILMPHVHGRGHGIPMALTLIRCMHESISAGRSSLHVRHAAKVLLLTGIAAVGIGTAHLGELLLMLLLLLLGNTIVVATWRHLALGGN